jgi:hypothetical protein
MLHTWLQEVPRGPPSRLEWLPSLPLDPIPRSLQCSPTPASPPIASAAPALSLGTWLSKSPPQFLFPKAQLSPLRSPTPIPAVAPAAVCMGLGGSGSNSGGEQGRAEFPRPISLELQ